MTHDDTRSRSPRPFLHAAAVFAAMLSTFAGLAVTGAGFALALQWTAVF